MHKNLLPVSDESLPSWPSRSYRILFVFVYLKQIEGTEKEWPAQLVVLAMGFVSPESAISKPLKLELDQVIVDTLLCVVCRPIEAQRAVCVLHVFQLVRWQSPSHHTVVRACQFVYFRVNSGPITPIYCLSKFVGVFYFHDMPDVFCTISRCRLVASTIGVLTLIRGTPLLFFRPPACLPLPPTLSLSPSFPLSLPIDNTQRENIHAPYGDYRTNAEGVFSAGDCRRGQSLVVWAINEGRGAADAVNSYLAQKAEQQMEEETFIGAM